MIDWNGKLEAVHVDGRVVPTTLSQAKPDNDGDYWVVDPSGMYRYGLCCRPDGATDRAEWSIRNVEPTLRTSDEALRRMEALVLRMAAATPWDGKSFLDEARAIVAASKPVDPDLAIAQNIANDSPYDLTGLNEARTDRTNEQIRDAILAGVKAGRRTVPLEPVVRSLVANGISEPVARLYARDVLKALDA